MNEPALWTDLTVDQAESIRDFYADVTGWEPEPVAMDGYEDYMMKEEGEPVAGICHARGMNTGIPPVWIPYFRVHSLEESLQTCTDRGGTVITPARSFSGSKSYAIIRDPSGAVCAIWSEK